MPYLYHNPLMVLSPQNKISKVTVLFDGGANSTNPYSIAKVNWEGSDCIAIRWNVTENEWEDADKIAGTKICVGEPNSRGYPTWFILPYDFLKKLVDGDKNLNDILQEALDCCSL